MKKTALTFFTLLLVLTLNAQDIISLKGGEEIKAKVIEITDTEVKYKRWDNRKKGPMYTTKKQNISVIAYKNGTKDVFPTATISPNPFAVTEKAAPATAIKFQAYEHNFGEIRQNSENKYSFEFTNTGDIPLIIESAKGSCGCTVPDYPKHPVMPGARERIDVVYRPAKQKGFQKKTITITANTNPKNTILTIEANVKEVND
jgi:hypothetical protein